MSPNPLLEALYDVYWALQHGHSIHPSTVISEDGLPAVETLGNLLREYKRLPEPALLRRQRTWPRK